MLHHASKGCNKVSHRLTLLSYMRVEFVLLHDETASGSGAPTPYPPILHTSGQLAYLAPPSHKLTCTYVAAPQALSEIGRKVLLGAFHAVIDGNIKLVDHTMPYYSSPVM